MTGSEESKLTREAIIDAALDLFAREGYDAVSVRRITREAEVNVAAVHYHFGGKEGVLRGVTEQVVTPLNERRIQLLEEARAVTDPVPLPTLVEAFVRPDVETLVELQKRGATIAHMVGRIYSDRSPWIQEMANEQFGPTREHFLPAFRAALPHLSPDELRFRLANLVALVGHMFATWPDGGMSTAQAELTLARLIAFATPALGGPAATVGGASP